MAIAERDTSVIHLTSNYEHPRPARGGVSAGLAPPPVVVVVGMNAALLCTRHTTTLYSHTKLESDAAHHRSQSDAAMAETPAPHCAPGTLAHAPAARAAAATPAVAAHNLQRELGARHRVLEGDDQRRRVDGVSQL